MYVGKTHLQGPHVVLRYPVSIRKGSLFPAISIIKRLHLSLIILLMKEKMSHSRLMCVKTTPHKYEIYRFSITLAT